MVDTRRVVVAVGAVVGAVATGGCAILMARYGTPILLASSRTALLPAAVFVVALAVSIRRKMALKRRLVVAR